MAAMSIIKINIDETHNFVVEQNWIWILVLKPYKFLNFSVSFFFQL